MKGKKTYSVFFAVFFKEVIRDDFNFELVIFIKEIDIEITIFRFDWIFVWRTPKTFKEGVWDSLASSIEGVRSKGSLDVEKKERKEEYEGY